MSSKMERFFVARELTRMVLGQLHVAAQYVADQTRDPVLCHVSQALASASHGRWHEAAQRIADAARADKEAE
jgi:hypothetical protein